MQKTYASIVRLKGVKRARADMRPVDRRWVHTRLRPLPLQAVVEKALQAFTASLANKKKSTGG